MASLFSSPKIPTVPAPIPPPTIDNAGTNDYADRLRQRKGRLSTLLSPDMNESSAPVSRKSLLGQ